MYDQEKPQSQTNPWHHMEETQNTDSQTTAGRQFFSKMIAKLERTLSNTLQNKDQTQTPTQQ